MEEKVFTTKEAANYLGISTSTIYRMEKQGLITSIKTPGGQRRFSKEEIDSYLQRSKDFEAPQNPSRFKRGELAISETVAVYHANQVEYKGCIFTCTNKTEKECLDRMLFATIDITSLRKGKKLKKPHGVRGF